MSSTEITKIRVALEKALKAITPALETSWQNMDYTPRDGVPYQDAFFMPASPDNSEFGSGHIEQGIFQVNLMYPLMKGTKDSATRAGLIRDQFFRGASFTNGGIKVTVEKTPEVAGGREESGRWMTPIKIRWRAQI